MKTLVRWLLSLAFVIASGTAFAVIPTSAEYRAYLNSSTENPNGWASAKSSATTLWCGWKVSTGAYKSCSVVQTDYFSYVLPGTTAATTDGPVRFVQRSVCPSNSSQLGASCVCSEGFNEVNGQCVAPKCEVGLKTSVIFGIGWARYRDIAP